MEQPEQGVIKSVIDCGSVVQVILDTDDGVRVLAADGNMWRSAHAAIGKTSLCGLRIEFEVSDWGGLQWFSVLPASDHVRCPNCGRFIPPHLEPDFCAWGLHRRKNLGNKNGAHRDED